MPWNIRRDFHLDINAEYGSFLIVSGTDGSLRQPAPDVVAGDGMPVRFHFWERGPNGSLTAADPGSERVFIFSGRPAGAPAGSDLLFVTNDFTEISAGVWEGTLDLTAPEFSEHLADAVNGEKIILGELEVRDGEANTKRTSFQFDLTARRQVYNGEAPPLGLGGSAWFGFGYPDLETMTPAGPLFSGAYSITFQPLILAAFSGGRPLFTDTGLNGTPGVDFEQILIWEHLASRWALRNYGPNGGTWESEDDVDDPSTIESFTPTAGCSGEATISKTIGTQGLLRAIEGGELLFVSQILGTARLWSSIGG